MNTKKYIIIASLFAICSSLIAFSNPSTTLADGPLCTPFAQKQCISNISYWYDSCGILQDINQNCNLNNQICQNGACINKQPVYVQNYGKKCSNNSVYWYDSKGALQNIYKNCTDNNSCTVDSCTSAQCKNTLVCDGSTCGTNSADYITYCNGGQTPSPSPVLTPTPNPLPTPGQMQGGGLSIAIFGNKDANKNELQKSLNANNNEAITFLIAIKNTSPSPINNAVVTTDIPPTITYTGNLKIDNADATGNIASGMDLGTLNPGISKSISFTGTAMTQTNQTTSQIIARINGQNNADSDSLAITSAIATDNTPQSSTNQVVTDFIKHYLIWIIIIVVLIILFFILFRRLSSPV